MPGNGSATPLEQIEYARVLFKNNPSATNRRELARLLRNAAHSLWYDMQYEQAKPCYREAIEHYTALDDEPELYKLYRGLGRCQSCLGDHEGAVESFQRLASLCPPPHLNDAENRAKIPYYLSIIYGRTGRWKESRVAAHRAYTIARQGRVAGLALEGEARALVELGRPGEAVALFQEAERELRFVEDRQYRAAVLAVDVAFCFSALNKLREAEQQFTKAIGLLEELDDLYARPFHGRARVRERLKNTAGAARDYRTAVELVEQRRGELGVGHNRRDFSARHRQLFEDAVKFFISAGDASEAYRIARLAKARIFIERVLAGQDGAVPACRELDQLSARLDSAFEDAGPSDTTAALEREYERLERECLERYAPLLPAAEPVPLDAVRKRLPEGSAVVEYFLTDNLLFRFILTRAGLSAHTTGLKRDTAALMTTNVRLWTATLEHAWDPTVRTAREELLSDYLARISPDMIAGLPERVRQVMFVPHGPLHYFPFSLLVLPDGKRLIEQCAISVIPAVELLGRRQPRVPAGVLAVCDPLGDLPSAGDEARIIAARYPDATILAGPAAVKSRVLAELPRHGIVHIACHAKPNLERPLFSELQVAGPGGRRARLTIAELSRLRLQAGLIVLSACESALGDVAADDELTSFPRAFLAAGARRVLASLWELDDGSAAELMRRFYAALATGAEPPEALRTGQLSLLKDGFGPCHWAGFIIIGS